MYSISRNCSAMQSATQNRAHVRDEIAHGSPVPTDVAILAEVRRRSVSWSIRQQHIIALIIDRHQKC